MKKLYSFCATLLLFASGAAWGMERDNSELWIEDLSDEDVVLGEKQQELASVGAKINEGFAAIFCGYKKMCVIVESHQRKEHLKELEQVKNELEQNLKKYIEGNIGLWALSREEDEKSELLNLVNSAIDWKVQLNANWERMILQEQK